MNRKFHKHAVNMESPLPCWLCSIGPDPVPPAGGGDPAPEPKPDAVAASVETQPTVPVTVTPEVAAALEKANVPVAETSTGEKVVHLANSAVERIKQESVESGTKAALDNLEDQARKAGFASFADMQRIAIQAKEDAAKPALDVPVEPVPENVSAEEAKLRTQLVNSIDRNRKLGTQLTAEKAMREQLQDKLDATEAEMQLRLAATKAGVQDVDYAVELLRRKLKGKTQEQLGAFDESSYFTTDLKKSHPYLYQPVVVPANTSGSGTTAEPAPAAQSQQTKAQIDAKKTDASQLSREEYDNLLSKHGLNNPQNGLSY